MPRSGGSNSFPDINAEFLGSVNLGGLEGDLRFLEDCAKRCPYGDRGGLSGPEGTVTTNAGPEIVAGARPSFVRHRRWGQSEKNRKKEYTEE